MSEWLVSGLIPKGHSVMLLGQPHSYKSWFAERLAYCALKGFPMFLGEDGFKVEKSSVVLIDEDTPTNTLDDRLSRLGINRKESPILVQSMGGFELVRNSLDLKNTIDNLPSPVLVVIDSLSSVSGSYDENKTKDAIELGKSWNRLKSPEVTVIIIHHASEKRQMSHNDSSFTDKAMGNTQLNAKTDTIIGFLRSSDEKFIFRPQERRTELPVKGAHSAGILQGGDRVFMVYYGVAVEDVLEEVKLTFSTLYRDKHTLTISEAVEKSDGALSENEARKAFRELEAHDCVYRGVEAHNRFQYTINPAFLDDWKMLTPYQETLLDSVRRYEEKVKKIKHI